MGAQGGLFTNQQGLGQQFGTNIGNLVTGGMFGLGPLGSSPIDVNAEIKDIALDTARPIINQVVKQPAINKPYQAPNMQFGSGKNYGGAFGNTPPSGGKSYQAPAPQKMDYGIDTMMEPSNMALAISPPIGNLPQSKPYIGFGPNPI